MIVRKILPPRLVASSATLLYFILAIQLTIFAQDPEEVIRVDSNVVVLSATVRDSQSRPVTGLRKSDFRIFDNGLEQSITDFEAQESPFSAVILFDTSGSMENRIRIARSAAIAFLDGLRAGDAAAIYKFDSKTELVQDFSESRDVADRVFDLRAEGMTVLNDAIVLAVTELVKRPEKRKAVIVLSDGADTRSRYSAERALRSALTAGVIIYTVDMSSIDEDGRIRQQNHGVLRNFAEKTGGTFISIENGVAMRDALKAVVNELRGQYTMSFEPSGLKYDGKWHEIELRVKKPNLTIRTRRGYNAPKPRN